MTDIPDCFSPAEQQAASTIAGILKSLSDRDRAYVLDKASKKFDVQEATRLVNAVTSNPLIPDAIARDILRPVIDEAVEEKSRLEADITQLKQEKTLLAHHIDCLRELENWSQKPPVLAIERNDCSRLHKLKEAADKGNLIDGSTKGNEVIASKLTTLAQTTSHTFVVKHDWARAFENAADWKSGEFKLPYDLCCFEFRLDGRTIILWAMNTEKVPGIDRNMSFTSFVECRDCWYSPPETPLDDFEKYLWDQVRAICISLDAEIAVTTVERAPLALNEKRQKAGKPPLSDFHVVDLSKRHRVANSADGAGEGSKKRLHFRRGHWRHFETSKTWVKWCLVGNPDLGFISKSYTL